VNVVNSNKAVRATSIDSSTISRPTDAHWSWWFLLLIFILNFDLREQVLRISGNIENFDTSISGNSQPLVGCVEDKRVNDRFTFVFSIWLSQIMVIPHFDNLVFSTGGDVQTVSGNVKSIDVRFMSFDGSDVLEDTVPDFESTVPTN